MDDFQEMLNRIKQYNKSSLFQFNLAVYQLSQTISRQVYGQIISYENRPTEKVYRNI